MAGIIDKLKEIYLLLEDRYYSVLDKIDAKIPIYGVIDKVDRVVPSFLILIAVAVLLVAWASLMLLGGIAAPAMLTLTVLDEQDSPIEGASITATFPGGSLQLATDASGEARLSVPLGAVVDLTITKADFEDKTASVTVSKAEQPESFTLLSLVPLPQLPTEKTLEFVDGSGKKLVGVDVSVSFGCSNAGVAAPAPKVVSTGELKITPPRGCGVLTVNATASGYRSTAYSVDKSMRIMLEALASGQGSLKITVTDADTGYAVNGIKVVLRNDLGDVDTSYTDFGEVMFSGIVPATYSVTVEDDDGDYGSETITGILVVQGVITRRDVQISKSVKANLCVTAEDEASGAAIEDVEITLLTEDGDVAGTQTTDDEGVACFAVSDDGNYFVSGFQDGYLVSGRVSVDLSDAEGGEEVDITIEMEELTPENSGRVIVRVFDEDSLPVENATVSLFDAATGFLAGYPPQTTDANGIAGFLGVAAGDYYAKAHKYPSEGRSDAGTVDVMVVNEFVVNMVIGEATVRVVAVDEDGDPIPFADAEIESEIGDELGTIQLNAAGVGEISIKADKRVFATVSAINYASYHSEAVQLFKDQVITITAELVREILGTEPGIEFRGMYDGSSEVDVLTAGEEYRAKFRVSVPSGVSYSQVGLHVRTGANDVDMVEKDPLYINAINAPGTSWIKGGTYDPPTGTDVATNGNAKWANILWAGDGIESGTYDVSVDIKVRRETVQGTELQLHYRAWAVIAGGRYVRDPPDAYLGEAAGTAAKKGLYAAAYDEYFYEGAQSMCDEDFCYSERLYDPAEQLYIPDEPYTVKVFGNYDFNFWITNNSDSEIYSNNATTLRIRNTEDGTSIDDSIRITSYEITDAASVKHSGSPTGAQRFELPWISSLGEFGPHKTISADLALQPSKVGNSRMQARIISAGNEVFAHETRFTIVRAEDLVPEVKPDVLAAYTEIDLNVHVAYEGGTLSGFDVDDALVRVIRIAPDTSETVQTAKTNINGVAGFAIPASSPNTKVRVQVEKAGFASSEVEKIVTCGVVEFTTADGDAIGDGAPIESALNLVSPLEQEILLNAKSLVPQAISIVDLEIVDAAPGGVFGGWLDLGTMNNFLALYEGLEFTALGQEKDFKVKTRLSNYAKSELDEKKTLSGLVKVGVGGSTFTQACEFSLPLDIGISLVPAPEDEECLDIDNWEWKEPIIGSIAQWQFTITNNCMAEGSSEPNIDVEKLKAELNWNSVEYGGVLLTIIDPVSGSSGTTELEERKMEVFSDVLKAGEEYTGLLEFSPYPPYLADKPAEPAIFEIALEAGVHKGGGDIAKGNTNIFAELTFVDAQFCVNVVTPNSGSNGGNGGSGDGGGDESEEAYVEPVSEIVLELDEDEATFQIDTSKCVVKVDIQLCGYDNGNCRGGAPEGEIGVDPWVLDDVSPNQLRTVTVSRKDIPGYYDIEIKVKPEGSASWQKVMLLPVIIKPDGKRRPTSVNYFSMPIDYKVTLLGMDAIETTSLKNNYFIENVSVYANECDWGDSADEFDYGSLVVIEALVPGVLILDLIFMSIIPGYDGIVGEIVDAIDDLFGGDDDCSDHHDTNLVPDSIISLYNDFNGAKLEFGDPQIDGYILMDLNAKGPVLSIREEGMPANPNNPNRGVLPMAEEVELRFKNSGYENPEPVYGTFSITVKESVHGDTLHLKPLVECVDGDTFGPMHIWCKGGGKCYLKNTTSCGTPGSQSIVTTNPEMGDPVMPPLITTAKFHMRFDTQPFETGIPDVEFDTAHCARGTMIGAIGDNAPLPRIQYNWNWSDIPLDYCDAGSPGPMYCDATQFAIMLNKRMYALYEFLEENGFDLPCPPRNEQNAIGSFNADESTHTVPSGEIGMNSISANLEGTTAEVQATVENNTDKNQSGNVRIVVAKSGAASNAGDCTVGFDLNAGGGPNDTKTVSCTATGLEASSTAPLVGYVTSIYTAGAVVQDAHTEPGDADSTASIDGAPVKAMFLVEGEGCWVPLKTTDASMGVSQILPWVQHGGVTWTSDVPDADALDRLVNFEAYLMRDGFTEDFRKDFVHYYANVSFLGTPTYFNGLGTDFVGRPYGFASLLDAGLVQIGNKWDITQNTLSAPGLYKVNVAVVFVGDDWHFFDASGAALVIVPVMLEKLSDPGIPSPFYWMPMDGFVGVGPDYTINRQGYGTSFTNADTTKLVQFDNSATPFKTYPDAGSNAIVSVSSEVEEGFKAISTDSDTYGTLLDIRYNQDGTANITIAPQHATPVMMEVSRPQPSSEKFGAFYSAMQSSVAVDAGDHLARWQGAGNCLDFSGTIVWEKFNNAYDRTATQQDLMNWIKTYGVDWDSIVEPGDVYLRTIFYTPSKTSNALKAIQPLDSVKFITPDAVAATVPLNGIAGMSFNSQEDAIRSVEDVFQLVRDGVVCLTPTTTSAKFWWSPKSIYDAQGNQDPYVVSSYSGDCEGQPRSINCETASLEGGVNCIG